MENETIKKDNTLYREAIATAIASLVGEQTIIDDLSITKVIDKLIPVVERAASHSYDVGRIHQVNGGSKTEFLNKYFPNVTKENDIAFLP